MSDRKASSWNWGRALVVFLAISSISVVSIECLARLFDWIDAGVPFLANPESHSALTVDVNGLTQGRPNGRYKKWQLNSLGFRGPEVSRARRAACFRVMVLGASEMFGLYESDGNDFSPVLQKDLAPHGCVEVINAAITGASLDAIRGYWEQWLGQLQPDVVLIYSSPLLSLDYELYDPNVRKNKPTRTPIATVITEPPPLGAFRLRLIDHLHDYVHLPSPVADWFLQRSVKEQVRSHERGWVLDGLPDEALPFYTSRLLGVIDRIEESGSSVVLMSHALKVTQAQVERSPHDKLFLSSWNVRVTPEAQVKFNDLANGELLRIAKTRGLAVVDIGELEMGCTECFFDATHFTDIGAARAAAAAAKVLEPMMAKRINGSSVAQAR
jgi:hypothetical protein